MNIDADNTITVPAGKELTLNLNGCTLSGVSDQTGANRNMFDVRGTMTVNGANTMTRAAANQSKFWWQYPINVGAQISIPIFSGLKKTNQIQEVRNQQQQLNMQREYAVEGIRLQLQQAVNNLVAAQQSMTSNSKTMEQAFEAFTIANARFSAGAGTGFHVMKGYLSLIAHSSHTCSRSSTTHRLCTTT